MGEHPKKGLDDSKKRHDALGSPNNQSSATPKLPAGYRTDSTLASFDSEKSFAAEEGLPTLPEVIENLGFGLAQIRAGIIGGGVMFADGAEILLISAVTESVAKSWGLAPAQKGMIVTIVFLGVMVGNFTSGPISDNYGRRHLIIISFLGIFLLSIFSSLTMGFVGLCCVRFFVGASFGIGQPAWNTLGAEVTPAKWRMIMQAITQACFVLGEVYSTVLLLADDPSMENLHWRRLLQLGSIPAACFMVAAFFFLNQSPSYLAVTNQYDAAKDVLVSMRRDNGAYDVPIDFRIARKRSDLPRRHQRLSRRSSVKKQDMWRQCKVVFGRQLRVSTGIVMYSMFVLNMLYYGCLYAFPQVLASELEQEGGGAAIQLLIGALWELPGQALGIAMGLMMPRILNIKVYLLLTLASLLSFSLAMQVHTSASLVFRTIGYYGIKCFTDIGFVIIWQYSIEIYPTEARTTGSAISIGIGRIAAMIAPLIFEWVLGATGSYFVFFLILIFATAANLVLSMFLTIETAGMPLVDELEEEPAESSGSASEKDLSPVAAKDSEAVPLIKEVEGAPLIAEPLAPRF